MCKKILELFQSIFSWGDGTAHTNTLKEMMSEIIKDTSKWNYYGEMHPFSTEMLVDAGDCYSFISTYIHNSDKDCAPYMKYLAALKDYEEHGIKGFRLCHIVSTFFLGLTLYNMGEPIQGWIMNELKNLRTQEGIAVFEPNDDIDKQFIFVWFMVCMFHDLGYAFEKKITNDDITLMDLITEENKLKMHFLQLEKVGLPSHYEIIAEKYLKYRETKRNTDHGIIGGLSFDKYVCEIRATKYNSARDADKNVWKPELDTLYHYVAWRICCHNIWYVRAWDSPAKDFAHYIICDLFPLILSNEKTADGSYKDFPLKFEREPLFCFLCLVDSVDPIKICGHIPEDLKFEMKDNTISISCQSNSLYLEKIAGISQWLINIEKEKNKISFKLRHSK